MRLASVVCTIFASHALDGLVQAHFSHLGDGDDSAVRLAKEEIQMARTHAAEADEAQVDPLAWFVRPDVGPNDVGCNDRSCRSRPDELTT